MPLPASRGRAPTLAAVAAFLAVNALAANLVPALRARQVDPATILREE